MAIQDVGASPEELPPIEVRVEDSWSIQVIDELGRGLQDAALHGHGAEALIRLGRTDSDGRCILTRGDLRYARLEARKPGYATATRFLGPEPEEVVIPMSDARTIRGKVQLQNGQGASRITVVALPAGELQDCEFFRCCCSPNPPRHVVTTEPDGSFSIEDVREEGIYLLFAGGRGLLGGPIYDVRPSEHANWDIVVAPVFGAVVDFVDASGAVVAAPDTSRNYQTERLLLEGPHAAYLGPGAPHVFLLGVGQDGFDLPSRRLLLFQPTDASFASARLGPFLFTTDFPGFAIASIKAWAGPATEDLPTFELVHECVAAGFGAVEIRLIENDDLTPDGDALWAVARLQLFPKDGQRAREFVLEGLYDGADRVDRVPWGEHDVKVVFNNGAFVWPPDGSTETILVSPDEPALVAVDIRHLGSILIDVFLPAGDQYRGNLTLDLGEGEPIVLPDGSVSVTGGNPISFRHGPYWVKGLMPNTYSVKIRRLLSAQPDFRPLVVPVAAGEVSVLQMSMKSEN